MTTGQHLRIGDIRRSPTPRPGVTSLVALVLTVVLGQVTPALARDAELQGFLSRSGCPQARIKLLAEQRGIAVYEANCLNSSHRVLIVACSNGACRLEQPPIDEEDG